VERDPKVRLAKLGTEFCMKDYFAICGTCRRRRSRRRDEREAIEQMPAAAIVHLSGSCSGRRRIGSRVKGYGVTKNLRIDVSFARMLECPKTGLVCETTS